MGKNFGSLGWNFALVGKNFGWVGWSSGFVGKLIGYDILPNVDFGKTCSDVALFGFDDVVKRCSSLLHWSLLWFINNILFLFM